jgi:hypothetical protein
MLGDCKWFASKFETRGVEHLPQESVAVHVQHIARPGINGAAFRMQEKFLGSSVERADINAMTFAFATLDMEEKVTAVGEELRPTVRIHDRAHLRYCGNDSATGGDPKNGAA